MLIYPTLASFSSRAVTSFFSFSEFALFDIPIHIYALMFDIFFSSTVSMHCYSVFLCKGEGGKSRRDKRNDKCTDRVNRHMFYGCRPEMLRESVQCTEESKTREVLICANEPDQTRPDKMTLDEYDTAAGLKEHIERKYKCRMCDRTDKTQGLPCILCGENGQGGGGGVKSYLTMLSKQRCGRRE